MSKIKSNKPSWRLNNTISFQTQTNLNNSQQMSNTSTIRMSQPNKLSSRPIMNMINKAVRNNDLATLLGEEQRRGKKLRTEPMHPENQLMKATETQFFETRKRFDSIWSQRKSQNEHVRRLKTELSKLSKEQEMLLHSKKNSHQITDKCDKKIEEQEFKLNEVLMQKKVLKWMKHRLILDRDLLKKRKAQFESDYHQILITLKEARKSNRLSVESLTNTKSLFEKFVTEINEQTFERTEHLNNVQSILEQKLNGFQTMYSQTENINSICDRVFSEKDPQQTEWYKIYLSSSLLRNILIYKMEKEMEKFQVVEQAYCKVMGITGIHLADQLVGRYLNKEDIYGQFLQKVSEKKKKIEELQKQREQLLKEYNERIEQKESLFKYDERIPIAEQENSLKVEKWQQKSRVLKTANSKLRQWLIRQILKFYRSNNSELFQEQLQHHSISQLFLEYLSHIKDTLVTIEPLNEQYLSPKLDKSSIKRVKNDRKYSFEVEKARGNSAYNESQQNIKEQLEVINQQREQFHRKNATFMREAKRRSLQRKKDQLQKNYKEKK